MDFLVQVDDSKLTSFTTSSKSELQLKINGIANDIVDEAMRIERSERGDGNNGEIVRNDVAKAASLFTRYIERQKGKKIFAFLEIFGSMSGLLAGIFLPMHNDNILYLVIGVIFILCSGGVSMYLINNKN